MVTVWDNAKNMERVTAHILIPAPNVTPTPLPTRTPIPMATATATLPVSSSLSLPAQPAPTATRAPILQSFQSPALPIPQSSNLPSTAPNSSSSVPPSSFPLWGAAAAAAIAAATGLALAAKRRRKDALRRACRDEEREQAERVRAAVEAKNAALEAARRAKTEALKIRNWLLGQAMVRNALSQSGLSQREQEQVRAEVRTRGVSAALGLVASLKQAAQARLLASWKAMEEKLKAPYHKPANNQPPTNAVMIPPLTAEQHTALVNWNVAAQVGAYMLTAGIGAGAGAVIGIEVGGPIGGGVGSIIGAMLGVGWGAYEALCIASVQDEFDEAYQRRSSVAVWRDGWRLNVYATNGDTTYVEANAPLSMLYVAVTTYLLSGKWP